MTTTSVSALEEIQAREAKHVLQTYRRNPINFVRGQGVKLFDATFCETGSNGSGGFMGAGDLENLPGGFAVKWHAHSRLLLGRSTEAVQRQHVRDGGGKRVQKFEVQSQDGSEWKTIFAGSTIGPDFKQSFPAVTARVVRLNILDSKEGPTIDEIEILK